MKFIIHTDKFVIYTNNYKASVLPLAQGFGDPFSSRELGGVWARDYGGTMFLGDGGWGGQRSMSLCNVRIWRSQVKKEVLNTEKERTRKSSKTRIGEPSLARFGLPLNQQHPISDTCSTHPTSARNVHRHTGAWCTIGMRTPNIVHACTHFHVQCIICDNTFIGTCLRHT